MPKPTHRWRALAGLCLSLAACGSQPSPGEQAQERAPNEQVGEPAKQDPAKPEPPPSPVVTITHEAKPSKQPPIFTLGVHPSSFDLAPRGWAPLREQLVAKRVEASLLVEADQLLARLEHPGIPMAVRGVIYSSLFDELMAAADQQRQFRELGSFGDAFPTTLGLALEVDPQAPLTVVITTMLTAARAGFESFEIVVEGPNGRGALMLGAEDEGEAEPCGQLAVVVATDGAFVSLGPPAGGPRSDWGRLPEVPRWCPDRRVLLSADGSCPTLRIVDGAVDRQGLAERLASVEHSCKVVRVGAETDAPWPRLVALIAELDALGRPVVLTLGSRGATDCSQTFVAGEHCIPGRDQFMAEADTDYEAVAAQLEARAAVGEVEQLQAKVGRGLDPEIVRRIIRAHINELRSCQRKGLDSGSSHGTLTIEFVIDPRGKVARADVAKRDAGVPESVGACFAKAVQRWTFTKPRTEIEVSVTAPFKVR